MERGSEKKVHVKKGSSSVCANIVLRQDQSQSFAIMCSFIIVYC